MTAAAGAGLRAAEESCSRGQFFLSGSSRPGWGLGGGGGQQGPGREGAAEFRNPRLEARPLQRSSWSFQWLRNPSNKVGVPVGAEGGGRNVALGGGRPTQLPLGSLIPYTRGSASFASLQRLLPSDPEPTHRGAKPC